MAVEIFSSSGCGYCDRAKAIPQIFIGGAHTGGYEDLCHLDETGGLAKLLGGA